LARGIINRVRITDIDGYDGYFVDDVAPYDSIARNYKPRKDASLRSPTQAVGTYLETPVLHYSIGTKITNSVKKQMEDGGIDKIITHDKKPPFEPVMPRIMDISATDDDWTVRLGGFNLKKSFLDAATKGSKSKIGGTSYIPSVIAGKKIYNNFIKED
jgi:hypothetical protein